MRGHGKGTPIIEHGVKRPRDEEEVTTSSGNVKTSTRGNMQMNPVLGRQGNAPAAHSKRFQDHLQVAQHGLPREDRTEQERATDTISDSNTQEKKDEKFNRDQAAQFMRDKPKRDQERREKRQKYEKKKVWKAWLESITKPMGEYKDFETCVIANREKDNPDAYCGHIKHQVEKDGQGDARYANPHESGMEDPRKLQTTKDDFSLEEKKILKKMRKNNGKPYIERLKESI
mgnify:CR=1 FL=1